MELLVVTWLAVGLVLVGRFVEKRLAQRTVLPSTAVHEPTPAVQARSVAATATVRELANVAQALNEERAIEAACGLVGRAIGAERVEWWRHDRSRDAWSRADGTAASGSASAAASLDVLLHLALRRRAAVAPATSDVARRTWSEAAAVAVIPVFDRALTIGAMVARGAESATRSGFADDPTLDAVAAVLGVAIANARLSRQLHERQVKDPLTGLASVESLVQSVARSLTRGRVSVALMAMPQMRTINLRYGRQAGDRALAAVARLVALEAGEQAEVGRFGGATLLLVLPGVAAAQAQSLVERIVVRVGDTLRAGPHRGDEPLGLEAVVVDGEGGDAQVLLREAESRLTSRDGAHAQRTEEP